MSRPGRRAYARSPVREIAGLRLDPFRREVFRDGRYVALTRKQFAVLEVLVAAEGGVVSAEELLERAWDENAEQRRTANERPSPDKAPRTLRSEIGRCASTSVGSRARGQPAAR